jgi:hypothetical protein
MVSSRLVCWSSGFILGAVFAGSSLMGCAHVDIASLEHAASAYSAGEESVEADLADVPSDGPSRAVMHPAPDLEEGGAPLSRRVAIGGAAVAGLASVSGVMFAILAREKGRDAKDKTEELQAAGGTNACVNGERARECIALRRIWEDTDTFLNLAVWSLVGAGLIEVTMGVYGTLGATRKEHGNIKVSPAVSAQGAAVVVTGEF